MSQITNNDDVIDSRDIIERIKELEALHEDNDISPDEINELIDLKSLAEQGVDYSEDWEYGSTLIRDDCFTDYVMELLSEIGELPAEFPSYIIIDEEATARNIQMDYTDIEFADITYWTR